MYLELAINMKPNFEKNLTLRKIFSLSTKSNFLFRGLKKT